MKARKGYVRLRGQESRTSLNKVSILARKLTSVYARITTKMEFTPEVHQHSAGLILYYDNMNYINLRKYYSETLGQSALSIIHLENGEKTEFLNTRIPVEDKPVYLRPGLSGAMTEKLMKRSDVSLTPQDFLMSTVSTENLQEPWWGSPVQTAFSTKNVRTLTTLNILQMRAVWWSKKIQKNGDLSL